MRREELGRPCSCGVLRRQLAGAFGGHSYRAQGRILSAGSISLFPAHSWQLSGADCIPQDILESCPPQSVSMIVSVNDGVKIKSLGQAESCTHVLVNGQLQTHRHAQGEKTV